MTNLPPVHLLLDSDRKPRKKSIYLYKLKLVKYDQFVNTALRCICCWTLTVTTYTLSVCKHTLHYAIFCRNLQ